MECATHARVYRCSPKTARAEGGVEAAGRARSRRSSDSGSRRDRARFVRRTPQTRKKEVAARQGREGGTALAFLPYKSP